MGAMCNKISEVQWFILWFRPEIEELSCVEGGLSAVSELIESNG
jgi:hypothetical protein